MMTKNCPKITGFHLSHDKLSRENMCYSGTGGVSNENRSLGFIPAFCDTDSGKIYLSCHKDGTQAAIHMLDGLPDKLVTARDAQHRIIAIKPSVIPGFVKEGHFYTREQAAEKVISKSEDTN